MDSVKPFKVIITTIKYVIASSFIRNMSQMISKWLVLYSKESPFDVVNLGDLSPGSAHITIMIGQEPNKVFSDIENLGNFNSYMILADQCEPLMSNGC